MLRRLTTHVRLWWLLVDDGKQANKIARGALNGDRLESARRDGWQRSRHEVSSLACLVSPEGG